MFRQRSLTDRSARLNNVRGSVMKSDIDVKQCETQEKARASGIEISASIGRNTLFGVITNITSIGTRLVTVPIVISYIGLDGYGIWSIIMIAGAYMRFGTVGVKSAFQKYVAVATGNHDYEAVSKLLSTGCALLFFLSVLGLIPIALYSRNIATWAGVPHRFLASAGGAISMLAVFMLIANTGAAYEAIVMGGHRIDLVRKANIILCVFEAIFVVVVLWLGYGLFAMAGVMGISQLCYIIWCYLASSKVVPQIQVAPRHITKTVFRELLRYAGSYQLVSVLQMVYVALIPVAILRGGFGADVVGVYALAQRLVSPVEMMRSALFVPMLSGGAMVYASGAIERMRTLLIKSFKVTLLLSLPMLTFVSAFGLTIVLAWTGTTNALLPVVLIWVSLSSLFGTFSVLGLVLYRVSGQAIMDNLREVTRITVLLVVLMLIQRLGLNGVLAAAAGAELLGLTIMFIALARTYDVFRLRYLLPEVCRVVAATILVIGAGWIASQLSVPVSVGVRTEAAIRLTVICLTCAAAAWPSAIFTGAVSRSEVGAILGIFRGKVRANV